MRTKQQYICRRARRQICCAEKASQSFTSTDVKAVKPVFCRDMRALQRGASLARYGAIHLLAENTLRGASVELSAISGQLRRRAQRILFEKVALPLFRRSQRDGQSRLFFFCFAVWDGKKQKSGIISQVLLYNREKLCYHNSARLSCAFPHLGRGGFTDPPLSVGRI